MNITECKGYKKLLEAVEFDEKQSPNFHDYRAKLKWIIERVNHYSTITGVSESDILNAWEEKRSYWYMNFYQEPNQPIIDGNGNRVKVFDSIEDFKKSLGNMTFRCPACGEISTDPYKCNSGKKVSKNKTCDWKVYGLLGDLGKGMFVFIKEKMIGEQIFMPISWEIKEAL